MEKSIKLDSMDTSQNKQNPQSQYLHPLIDKIAMYIDGQMILEKLEDVEEAWDEWLELYDFSRWLKHSHSITDEVVAEMEDELLIAKVSCYTIMQEILELPEDIQQEIWGSSLASLSLDEEMLTDYLLEMLDEIWVREYDRGGNNPGFYSHNVVKLVLPKLIALVYQKKTIPDLCNLDDYNDIVGKLG